MERGLPIAVVGAGPAGASAALYLKRAGFAHVSLFERRTWPRPKTCAGGLGPRALAWLKHAGLLATVAPHAVSIERLYFTGPSRRRDLLAAPDTTAKVMVRERFDALMVEQALRAGVRFHPATRIEALARTPTGVAVVTDGRASEFGAIVVATGSAPLTGVDPPAHRRVRSIMARFASFPHDPLAIEMIMSRELAPYYAWLFPEPDGTVNVGLLADYGPGRKSLHALFDEVLDRYFSERVAKATLVGRRVGAPLHVGRGVGPVASGQVLLIGEAAGLVNAATGEGIPWALASGELVAGVLAKHEPDELAVAHARAMRQRFRLRQFAAERARSFIGGPLFALLTRLGQLPGVRPLLARLFANA
jgi:menaquinone-9 beta-reductase